MSTRTLLHVAGIGATAFKAELILAVWTFDVVALDRVSPILLALGALLQFTFFYLLLYQLISEYVDIVLNLLGANVVHIL